MRSQQFCSHQMHGWHVRLQRNRFGWNCLPCGLYPNKIQYWMSSWSVIVVFDFLSFHGILIFFFFYLAFGRCFCGVLNIRQRDEWENRRYNYVIFGNGSINGHNVLCFKAEQTAFGFRSGRLTNECGNCFCLCDEPGEKSDRYFSLRDVTSDIGANK